MMRSSYAVRREEQVPGPAVQSENERGKRHENMGVDAFSRGPGRDLQLPDLGPVARTARARTENGNRPPGPESESGSSESSSADAPPDRCPARGAARGRRARSAGD